MANLNRVFLLGNLTRDPELRRTPKGTAVTEIAMAINRVLPAEDGGEKREEVTYVDVTLWGRQAEVAQEYLTKGRAVFIEGRLSLDTWDDKQTGQKRSKLKVVAEGMQLIGGKGGQSDMPPSTPSAARAGGRNSPQAPPTSKGRPFSPGAHPEELEPLDVPF